jgi:ADP-ribose pyrophosphatase YjhB (NUDIX family)
LSAYAPQPGKGPWVGAGVGAIIVDGGRVLLLKRKKEPEAGCWGIRGGALVFGEITEEAARRELREKLGVECEVVRLLGSRTTSSPERAYTGSRRCS